MSTLNRRRHQRKHIVKATECVLNQHPSTNETFDCIIADISTSGVCLLTTKPIQTSQKVTFMNNIVPSNRTGIVRWSEKYKGLYYRSGLEFN